MADPKHTPTPWRSFLVEGTEETFRIRDNVLNLDIATVHGGTRSVEANLALFMAAPDLLEALTGMVAAYNSLLDHIGDEEFDLIAHRPDSHRSKAEAALSRALPQPDGGE